MIDWANLLFNTFWIVALALALAIVSWSSWQASVNKTGLRSELNRAGPQRGLYLAGFLFSLGLALTSSIVYEQVIWFLFATYFLVQLVLMTFKPGSTGT